MKNLNAVVFGISAKKSPGPDSYHVSFFRKMWNVVGEQVTEICFSILNGAKSVREFNETIMVLIRKIKNPTKMGDFRLISLCNALYKIATKAIANRLKLVLDPIISQIQIAFFLNRLITDNIIVAYEVMHSFLQRSTRKLGWVSLKLDMSKTYDLVKWKFVE